MANYFMLKCYGEDPGASADVTIASDIDAGWFTGSRLTEPVPDPVECEVIEDGEMVSMFQADGLLMTDRLVSALREAGVDNLDVYNAIVRHPDSGETRTNYKAVNIVGVISAVDLARSNPLERGGDLIDVPFEGVAIDEDKAGDMLMFRLAESVGGIVVHERVKEHLERAGFRDLQFLEPAIWLG